MALPGVQSSREYNNFSDNGDQTTSRFVKIVGGGIQFKWDAFTVAYPSADTEVYTFYTGGLAGTVQGTATLVYTNSSKNDLASGVISGV